MEARTVADWVDVVNSLFEAGDDSGNTDYYEVADYIDGYIDGHQRDATVSIPLSNTQLELVSFASS